MQGWGGMSDVRSATAFLIDLPSDAITIEATNMTRRMFALASLSLVLSSFSDRPAGAEDPTEDPTLQLGPPGYTIALQEYEAFEKDVIAKFLASRQWGDTLVREKKIDKGIERSSIDISNWHDPEWDDAALAFLRNWGRRLHEAPMAPSTGELFEEGWAIYEAGCREPMVTYANAWVLEKEGKRTSAHPVFLQAASSIGFTEYGFRWRSAVERRLAFSIARKGFTDQANIHHQASARHLIEAVKAGEFSDPIGQRTMAEMAVNRCAGEWIPLEMAQEFVDELSNLDGVDPCTLHYVLGEYHIRRAWDYRGDGLAKTVTKEGWAGFHKHLDIARDHLAKAYELDPGRPEAAASMITLCRVGHAPEGTDLGLWLDRATEAQIDYGPAFDAALSALQPRWGGSHETALQLGAICAATERYDTKLPMVYLHALQQIYFDNMSPGRWVLDDPAVYELASDVVEGLAAHPNHHHYRTWLRSVQIGIAYNAGLLDEVRQLALSAGDDLNPHGLRYFGVDREAIDRIASPERVTSAESSGRP